MEFCIYILYSEKFDQIYIGQTSSFIQRFQSHNTLATKGHTIKYRPWTVVYTEFFATKTLAIIREKQLKSSQGRTWIRANLDIVAGFISVS